MNHTFSFYITAENYTYNFSLPLKFGNCVVATGLRHPDVSNFKTNMGKIPYTLSEAIPIDDFQNDLNQFVNYLENLHMPIKIEMLCEALIIVCKKHIERCGRLLYVDLLSYVDVFIYVDFAIFSSDENIYRNIYKKAVYLILEKFPNNILFQNGLNGFHSWADIPADD